MSVVNTMDAKHLLSNCVFIAQQMTFFILFSRFKSFTNKTCIHVHIAYIVYFLHYLNSIDIF